MPSKTALEAEIARLKSVIKAQESAVSKLSLDKGVEIVLPWAQHGMAHGPLILDDGVDRKERVLDAKILRVLWDVVNRYGIPVGHYECPGAFAGADLTPVCGDGFSSGKRFVLPSIAGVFMAELLNGVAEYAAACYRDGYANGTDHTRQLACGQMTATDFEDTVGREKATAIQEQKRYVVRKRKR